MLKVVQLESGRGRDQASGTMAPESVVLSTKKIYQVAGDTRLSWGSGAGQESLGLVSRFTLQSCNQSKLSEDPTC